MKFKSRVLTIILFRIIPLALASYLIYREQKPLVYDHKEIEGIKDNWKSQPFTSFLSEQTKPADYKGEQIFVGDWPGTIEGCDCVVVDQCKSGIRHHKLNRGTCTADELFCGCQTVKAHPPKKLTTFPEDYKFYGIRTTGMSFAEVYKNMLETGSCKEGFKKCGNINSISKGICVPKAKECPVTAFIVDIEVPDGMDFEFEIKGKKELNIYYTKKQVDNPILELKMAEAHICTDLSRAVSPGRKDYPLMAVLGNSECFIDKRYEEMRSEAGLKTVLEKNLIKFNDLPGFSPSDTFKFKKFGRELVEIQPTCLYIVPQFLDEDTFLDKVKSNLVFSYKFGFILLGVSILINFLLMAPKTKDKAARLKLDIIFLPLLFLSSIVFVGIVVYSTYRFSRARKVFNEWDSLKCAERFTNNRIRDASYTLDAGTLTVFFIIIGILLASLAADLVIFFFKVKGDKDKFGQETLDSMVADGYAKADEESMVEDGDSRVDL